MDTIEKRVVIRGLLESQLWIENDLQEICVAFSRIEHDEEAIFVALLQSHLAQAQGTQFRNKYDTEDDNTQLLSHVSLAQLSVPSDDGEEQAIMSQ